MKTRDEKLTLVCAADPSRWNRLSRHHAVIIVRNAALLTAALDRGCDESEKDIQRVVFDRSIPAVQFLAVLAELPQTYRGDVLFIAESGEAFLSAVAPRGDGRALFALGSSDVEFYLDAAFARGATRRVVDATPAFTFAA